VGEGESSWEEEMVVAENEHCGQKEGEGEGERMGGQPGNG